MVIDWTKYDLGKAKELAKKFGKAAVTEMAFNIQQLGLVDRGNLLRSLKAGVRTKKEVVDRVVFSYEWYGRFHETGAENIFGKGASLNARHWRSQAINGQLIDTLSDDFSKFYGDLILEEITVNSAKMIM